MPTAQERVQSAKEGATKVWDTAKKNPARTMKVLSSVSGLLLVLSGFSGLFNLFNPLKAVISFYNMGFGILILATELKSWPIISTFQKRVDIYFHLLSVPKGKGGFYCFIGVLAFCASLDNFDLSSVCVLIVAIVGVLHLVSWGGAQIGPDDGESSTRGLGGSGLTGEDTSSAGQLPDGVAAFGMQVLKDNPGMLKAGLDFAAQNPDLAKQGAAAAFSAGTSQPPQ